MKSTIVHSFDEHDEAPFSADHASSAIDLLRAFVDHRAELVINPPGGLCFYQPIYDDMVVDVDGLRAMKRISDGQFEQKDIDTYRGYVIILTKRMRARAVEIGDMPDRPDQPAAQSVFAESMRDVANRAEKMADEFTGAFYDRLRGQSAAFLAMSRRATRKFGYVMPPPRPEPSLPLKKGG